MILLLLCFLSCVNRIWFGLVIYFKCFFNSNKPTICNNVLLFVMLKEAMNTINFSDPLPAHVIIDILRR